MIFTILQIDKKAMRSLGMVKRVCNEVEIHSQLKHPSILEVHLPYTFSLCTTPSYPSPLGGNKGVSR